MYLYHRKHYYMVVIIGYFNTEQALIEWSFPEGIEEIQLMVLTAQPKTRNFFTIKEHETSFH